MKKIIFFAIFLNLLKIDLINSQTQNLGKPQTFSSKIELPKNFIKMPFVSNYEQKAIYDNKSKETGEKILQYGFAHDVSIDFFKEAVKTVLPNKKNLYQLRIKSESAISLNIVFKEFNLVQGTVLYLLSSNKKKFIGAYTSLNNNKAKVLGSDLIYTDDIIIEVQEPIENENKSNLSIGKVIHGFINLDETFEKDLNESGDCNIDVNCPQGAGWSIQRNSVVMLVNGSGGFCTGAMVNNTSGNEIPYLLTANHCGNDPSSWTFRFRWETPQEDADCGTNSPSVNGPENMTLNGAITRAKSSPSDFHLIELNNLPNSSWDVVYAGWNRSETPANYGAGIHHPSGDIKKIALSSTEYESVTYTSNEEDHWKVYWSEGVTEGGSSGSPLFDQNRRIVGQLHGGASGCGSNDQSDSYGKFFTSWLGEGTENTRLKDWLDPTDSGLEAIDANVTYSIDAYLSNQIIGTEKTSCSGQIQTKFVLSNGGGINLTSATITYNIDGVSTDIDWTGDLASFESDTISLPMLNLNSGQHLLTITISNPNNSTDEVPSNNHVSSQFYVMSGGENFSLNINFDCYADENSWEIVNDLNQKIFSGGNYENNNTTPYSIVENVCLNQGCYKINFFDSYGDGMFDNFCDSAGSFSLTTILNDTLTQMYQSEAAFGDTIQKDFCVEISAKLNEKDIHFLKIYPNPIENEFTIISQEEIESIKIIDVLGNEVYFNEAVFNQKSEIKLNLNKGIYHVIVKTKNNILIKKLIKS